MLITACEDGLLRVVQIHPNKILSIIGGDIDPEDLVPLSALSLSFDKRYLASANHDFVVSIYDVSDIGNKEMNEDSTDQDLKQDEEYEDMEEDKNEDDMNWSEI